MHGALTFLGAKRVDERVPDFPWPEEAIRSQLERILGHEEFRATDKMREFLRFVVEQTLAGNARHLKGYTIAVEVFGRGEEFDAAHDPVVRIQAGRLRRAMERYYLVAGGRDPIRIEIPKGGYVPVFSEGPSAGATRGDRPQRRRSRAGWPCVLVQPFEDMTGDPALAYLGPGLATELCIGLGSCPEFRVMLSDPQVTNAGTAQARPDFVVRGSVRRQGQEAKVVVQLIGAESGEQFWVDSIRAPLDDDGLITFQEDAANAITAHIAGEHGVIFRVVSGRRTDAAKREMSSYQAILKAYAYHQRVDEASYAEALTALTEAHRADPGCGLVCTMLAIMYADNLAMEFFDPGQTPLDEALHLAHEGVRLEPGNQLSRLVLARLHVLDEDLAAGLSEAEAALALHPDSMLFMDAIGYVMCLLGDFERGLPLVRRAIAENPYYRRFVHYATWLDAYRRGDDEGALAETPWLNGVGYFWDPLARAASLGQLGRKAEARAAVRELLELKPDFARRGRLLVRRYVKDPGLHRRIVEGLEGAGLVLESAEA